MKLLKLWFGLAEPVSRRAYAVSGVALFAFKFAVDSWIVHAATGQMWTPWSYLNPSWNLRMAPLQSGADPALSLFFVLGLWSVPFMWIGFSMTMRRAVDAGLSPWTGLLFFIPVVNYVVMLTLCLRPSRWGPADSWSPREGPTPPERLSQTALRAVVAAAAGGGIGLLLLLLSASVVRSYGSALFVGGPFVMGLVTAFLFNRVRPQPIAATAAVVVLCLTLVGGALLLFAIEGLLCILMAFPIALVEALLGALFGSALALGVQRARGSLAGAVLMLPVILVVDAAAPPPRERHVVTSVDVSAPPETVWNHVVGFAELPPPHELIFRLGIAYPTRARLLGRGVGAVRHCEFSTGPFVEPITVWDPPRRLAFDVTRQPPPMHEWSPYRHVNAAHLLDDTLRSRRGEFLLLPLPGGRTRLLGTTWYVIDMAPGSYWRLWSDMLIHRIHSRVLAHVKALAEAEALGQAQAWHARER